MFWGIEISPIAKVIVLQAKGNPLRSTVSPLVAMHHLPQRAGRAVVKTTADVASDGDRFIRGTQRKRGGQARGDVP